MTEREFTDLINKYKHTINLVCDRYCNSYSRADLVQEIIIETWKSISNFKKSCSFNSWLYLIARNKCISTLRKQTKQPIFEDIADYAEVLAEVGNSAEIVKQLRQAIRYNTVLDTIEEPYRTIFEMYLEGFTYEEL